MTLNFISWDKVHRGNSHPHGTPRRFRHGLNKFKAAKADPPRPYWDPARTLLGPPIVPLRSAVSTLNRPRCVFGALLPPYYHLPPLPVLASLQFLSSHHTSASQPQQSSPLSGLDSSKDSWLLCKIHLTLTLFWPVVVFASGVQQADALPHYLLCSNGKKGCLVGNLSFASTPLFRGLFHGK